VSTTGTRNRAYNYRYDYHYEYEYDPRPMATAYSSDTLAVVLVSSNTLVDVVLLTQI